jgi:hypothetical protein
MTTIKNIASALALAALVACGGGGDDGSGNSKEPAAVTCTAGSTDPFCQFDNPKPVVKPGG